MFILFLLGGCVVVILLLVLFTRLCIEKMVTNCRSNIIRYNIRIKELKNQIDGIYLSNFNSGKADKLTSDCNFRKIYELKKLKIMLKKNKAIVALFEKNIIEV